MPPVFCCALYQAKGVDGVFEQHDSRRRSTDFRQGEHLGPRDHLIEIDKPKVKSAWMSQAEYDQTPDRLKVRELHAGGKILVTTLLCSKSTRKAALKALCRNRWQVELDIRNIKTTPGLETLSYRTPEMAEKELWVYLLAYNLIRLLMAQAALLADIIPRQPSFKHTLQLWIVWQKSGRYDIDKIDGLFILIAPQQVGKQPGRMEPRAIKRRPRQFSQHPMVFPGISNPVFSLITSA